MIAARITSSPPEMARGHHQRDEAHGRNEQPGDVRDDAACSHWMHIREYPQRRQLLLAVIASANAPSSTPVGHSGAPTVAVRSTGCPASRCQATYAHVVTATQPMPSVMPTSTSLT